MVHCVSLRQSNIHHSCLSKCSHYVLVSLTKTKKKGLEGKKELINKLQDAIDRYNTVYLFRFEDMKNEKMKELREELKGDAR